MDTFGAFRSYSKEAPTLATAIDAGGERLRELALVPFNTRLLADLITSGLAPIASEEIQSQVQLLNSLLGQSRRSAMGPALSLCLQSAVSLNGRVAIVAR